MFGFFAIVNIAQIVVQPVTVLNYCLISCVAEMVESSQMQAGAGGEEVRKAESQLQETL